MYKFTQPQGMSINIINEKFFLRIVLCIKRRVTYYFEDLD